MACGFCVLRGDRVGSAAARVGEDGSNIISPSVPVLGTDSPISFPRSQSSGTHQVRIIAHFYRVSETSRMGNSIDESQSSANAVL